MNVNDGMQLMRKTVFVKAMQFVYEDMIKIYLESGDRHNIARSLIKHDTRRCISWAFVTGGEKRATPTTAMALLVEDMACSTWIDAANALFLAQLLRAGGCAHSRKNAEMLEMWTRARGNETCSVNNKTNQTT